MAMLVRSCSFLSFHELFFWFQVELHESAGQFRFWILAVRLGMSLYGGKIGKISADRGGVKLKR